MNMRLEDLDLLAVSRSQARGLLPCFFRSGPSRVLLPFNGYPWINSTYAPGIRWENYPLSFLLAAFVYRYEWGWPLIAGVAIHLMAG